MASQVDGAFVTFEAGEDLEQYRRVKLSGVKVVYADADEDCVGVTQAPVLNGYPVAVKTKKSPGTFKLVASEAIASGATIYGDADGKITDTDGGSYTKRGTALEAASGDGSIIQVLLD
jgi:hypothetical protein